MNRFDDEMCIIKDFQNVEDNTVLFTVKSKEAERVYQSIHSMNFSNIWTNSSGKSDPPPDFYSDELMLMMDVMRVDDHAFIDEKGKIQNPTNAGESKCYNELRKNGLLEVFPHADVIINATSSLPTEQDHCYNFYYENFKRVLSEHIKKIPLYNKNHPGYKTIFFVLDESSGYIECAGEKPDMNLIKVNNQIMGFPHLFLWDKAFIEVFMDKGIDFLIWFAPFKHIETNKGLFPLPEVVIFDGMLPLEIELKDYKKSRMCSTEL